jgi:hypothetical protein
VEISVTPHRFFPRKDDDIHIERPMALAEAVLGARITSHRRILRVLNPMHGLRSAMTALVETTRGGNQSRA